MTLGQVERAYKMYATGDFIVSRKPFSSDSWGSTTVQFMDYIANDLTERHWNSIFSMLYSFSAQVTKEEEMHNSTPHELCERVPLPLSDPPSPAHD